LSLWVIEVFRIARDDESLLVKVQSGGSPEAEVFGVESSLPLVDDYIQSISNN
jgi:hypothetical protein